MSASQFSTQAVAWTGAGAAQTPLAGGARGGRCQASAVAAGDVRAGAEPRAHPQGTRHAPAQAQAAMGPAADCLHERAAPRVVDEGSGQPAPRHLPRGGSSMLIFPLRAPPSPSSSTATSLRAARRRKTTLRRTNLCDEDPANVEVLYPAHPDRRPTAAPDLSS